MSSVHRWSAAALLAGTLALAAPVSAQYDASPNAEAFAGSVSLAAPVVLFPSMLDRSRLASEATEGMLAPPRARESQSVALMIVGGTALVIGSVIDGDSGTLIMVGGGVIGLIGLYQYLR